MGEGLLAGDRQRIPSGVAVERFRVDSEAQLVRERAALLKSAGLPPDSDACILLMVRRLRMEPPSSVCILLVP